MKLLYSISFMCEVLSSKEKVVKTRREKCDHSGFCGSPRENSKLMGLSPIFLSIMVASNNVPNSRNLSLSALSWTQIEKLLLSAYRHIWQHFTATLISKSIKLQLRACQTPQHHQYQNISKKHCDKKSNPITELICYRLH